MPGFLTGGTCVGRALDKYRGIWVLLFFAAGVATWYHPRARGDPAEPDFGTLWGYDARLLMLAWMGGSTLIYSCVDGVSNNQRLMLLATLYAQVLAGHFGGNRNSAYVPLWDVLLGLATCALFYFVY